MSLEQKIEELTQAVIDLTAAMGNGATAPAEEPEPEEEEEELPKKKTPAKKTTPAKKSTPAKRGRKPAGPTLATVHDKLREVQDELGKDTVKELLEEFEIKKVSELEEEDYKEFLEACDEALEEADEEE